MDQKHAMLYGELQPNATESRDRAIASSSIGLPTDRRGEPPPPSYDIAISHPTQPAQPARPPTMAAEAGSADNWYANANFQPAIGFNSPQSAMNSPQFPRNDIGTRSFADPNQQQYQQNTTAVHVLNTPHIPKLGPHPCNAFCPVCGTSQTTKMAYTPNTRTHFCAFILCLVGWCCCACLVPYCTDTCRTGNHYCSTCNTFLGTYNGHDGAQ